MADVRYPVFEGGQTLTKDDLNLLRDFLDGQDRLIGRLIGFGTVCGLEGAVTPGNTLSIGGGLALDQLGHGLMLETAATSAIPPAATQTFDFVEPGPGGVTPVLVFQEVDEPAPDCNETGCEAHAATRLRRAAVVFANGRLISGPEQFSTEPLLSVAPLTVSTTSVVQGSFVGLRNAIVSRLAQAGVVLSASGAARLGGLSIGSSDLPAVKIYKAGFLNQVLFATIELMRCRALHGAICLRTAAKPGVALGWLHTVAGVAVWDCRYRHAFVPPAGLSMALLGGGCDDPCDLVLDRLEALLASYVEPAVPAPADPPRDPPTRPDFHICPKWKTGYTTIHSYDDCLEVYIPPPHLPEDWPEIFRLPEKVGPVWDGGFTDPVRPDLVYDADPIDWAGAGATSLLPTWGTKAIGTKAVLESLVRDHDLVPDVRVVTPAEAAKLPGYGPQTTVSLGDTIVLVADAGGKVITTGRIANQHVLKSAGPALNTAVVQSAEAVTLTRELETEFAGVQGTLNVLNTGFASMTETLAQLDEVREMSGQYRAEAERFAEFRTEFAGWKGQQETLIQTVRHDVERTVQRVDDAYKVGFQGGGTKGPGLVGLSDLITNMHEVMELATPPAKKAGVRKVVQRSKPALDTLRAAESAGTPLAASERDALVLLVDQMLVGLKSTGAPAAKMAEVQRKAAEFKERIT